MRGMCVEGAHDAAWDDVGSEDRHRTHLDQSEAAREAVAEPAARLGADESLVLVCDENTSQKRCHRTLFENASSLSWLRSDVLERAGRRTRSLSLVGVENRKVGWGRFELPASSMSRRCHNQTRPPTRSDWLLPALLRIRRR